MCTHIASMHPPQACATNSKHMDGLPGQGGVDKNSPTHATHACCHLSARNTDRCWRAALTPLLGTYVHSPRLSACTHRKHIAGLDEEIVVHTLVLKVMNHGAENGCEHPHVHTFRPHRPEHPALSEQAVQSADHIGGVDPVSQW